MHRALAPLLALTFAACALPHRASDAAANGDVVDRAIDVPSPEVGIDVPEDDVPIDVPCVDVDLQTSVYHCGACGNRCPAPANADPTCASGMCGFACRTGAHPCGATCLLDDDPASCGMNCSPCQPPDHATATCSGGSCGFTCDTGFHDCGGVCVDDSSITQCGMDCRPCTAPVGGTAACISGMCQTGCPTGTHPCTGTCVADNDVNACGPRCTVCAVPVHATAACRSDNCAFDCASGYSLIAGECISVNCGNSALDSGESCDDGNHAMGDGCSPSCAMESGVITATCSATSTILIRAPGTYVYSGDTTSAANMLTDCSAGGGEQALALNINTGGPFTLMVTVHPTTSWRPVVRHSGDCTTLMCTDSGSNGADVSYSVSLPGAANGRIVIDGRGGGDHGPWVMTLVVM